MTDLKSTPYWAISADLVTYLKECLPVESSDEYWRRVTDRACQISRAYKDTLQRQYVNDQLNVIVDELGRIYEREVKPHETIQ